MYNPNQMYGINQYSGVGYSGYQQPISGIGYNSYQQPIQNKPMILQGKVIDNLEVVKATDILLDGSINYFPLADGSAIATKQLQPNGISKIVIYKPVEEEPIKEEAIKEEPMKNIKYITEEDFSNNISDMKNKINEIENKINTLLFKEKNKPNKKEEYKK